METKTIKKFVFFLPILLALLFSVWVRLWGLNSSPPSMNFDEAALGYNAYSLLKTARDEYGTFMPLSLRSFNDYKPALYSYLSIIPVAIWGLTDATTRAVSAVAGIATIGLLFLVLKEFFKEKWFLAMAFCVAAIQPWLIHYSRTAFESNLAATFFLAGVWLLIKEKPLLSAIPFAVAAYSYHSPRLAVPLVLFLYAADTIWPKIRKISLRTLLPLVVFAVLTVPIFISMRDSLILKRYQQTNIFKALYPFAPQELISSKNPWLSFPTNPVYFLGGDLLGHAASYLSPINLGERIYHTVRFSPMYIPSFGILGWFEALTVVPGIIFLISKLNERKYRLLLYWMMAGVSPAAVTWEWFHPLRSLDVFPALLVISLFGLFSLVRRWPKVLLFGVFVMVFVPTSIFVTENELDYLVYANHGEYQPGGFKEGVPVLSQLQGGYDKVIIDTPHAQAYIFFLFYQRFPPAEIQKYASIRPGPLTEGDLTFDFYKYDFRKIYWPDDKNLHHVIFWADPYLKDEEVSQTPGTRIIKIKNAIGTGAASIITKD